MMTKITNSPMQNNPLAAYQTDKTFDKFKEAQKKIGAVNQPRKEAADSIALSDQAKRLLEDAETVEDISQQMAAAADSKENPYDELTKCMLIASRIMKGDKVPQADIRFLAEKEPELYSSAMFMKQNSENPKRHKSLLEDEHDANIEIDSGKAEIQAALADRVPPAEE